VERILIPGAEEILVGHGLPEPLLPPSDRERVLVLTQPGARPIALTVAEAIDGVAVEIFELPDREAAKSLETVTRIYGRLMELALSRHDTIVAVGGGTVTDVAGFVAATWLRGVEVVHVPTTLLAAVDAAIGGKTGVNFRGKNLVGAFWHPSRVVVDLDVLEALPPELTREGTAEALKAGLIGDPGLVEAYRSRGAGVELGFTVTRAIRVKARVVEEDFRETGRRAILNYGHTVGHAVETLTGLPHGHAIAIGMVAAGEISRRRHGFDADDQRLLLERLGLPVSVGDAALRLSKEAVVAEILKDKKRDAGGIRFVLLRRVAEPVVAHVSDDELEAALAAIDVA